MTTSTDKEVLNRQRSAYKKLNETLNGLVKQTGTKGFLTRAFLNFRRHGLMGLIPSLGEVTDKLKGIGQGGKFAKTAFGKWLLPHLVSASEKAKQFVTNSIPLIGALHEMGAFKGFAWVAGIGVMITKWMQFNKLLSGAKGAADAAKTVGGLGSKLSGMGGSMLRVLGPIGLIASAGYLIYKNWDLIEPVVTEIWAVLQDLGKEIWDGLSPAFQELQDVGMVVWQALKDGVQMVWKDYLVPFGKWFHDNLPAMIGGGTEFILQSIAFLKFGMKRLGLEAAIAIDKMSTGWDYIAIVVENRVVGAFGKVASIFDVMFDTWDLGFLNLKAWLTTIPLELAKMVKSLASTSVGAKLLSMAGMDTKGIDASLNYWTKESKAANDAVDARKEQSALRDQANIAMDLNAKAREAKKLEAMNASSDRADAARQASNMAASDDLDRAAQARARVEGSVSAAQAARDRGEEPAAPATPAKPSGRHRGRKGTIVSATPSASPMAARQETSATKYLTRGGADIGAFFKDGLKVVLDSQQVAGIATKVVAAANNRKPRASPNGGGGEVP